jgi:quinol monooxygenase YgiN
MLIQSVRLTFAPENADKGESTLRELRDASRKEEGVNSYDVARSKDNPNVFVVWEVYRDGAALQSHMATEHFQRLVMSVLRSIASDLSIEVALPID